MYTYLNYEIDSLSMDISSSNIHINKKETIMFLVVFSQSCEKIIEISLTYFEKHLISFPVCTGKNETEKTAKKLF